MTSSSVLVINSGSSSIKYQLVDPETGDAIAKGIVERIGDTTGLIKHEHGDAVTKEELPVPDHTVGMREVLRLFDTEGPSLADANVVAVGHRIVQGGRHFDGPALITDEVRDLIEELCPLAPLHNPAHLKGIDVARELMPATRWRWNTTAGSMSPVRVPIISPSRGVRPMDVSIGWPFLTADTEAPLPRCRTICLRSSRPSIVEISWETNWWEVPCAP